MTSNLGAGEMNELIDGAMGFSAGPAKLDGKLDEKMNRTAVEAARRKFSPEFMNRIDKVVVFKTLAGRAPGEDSGDRAGHGSAAHSASHR